MLFYQTDVLLYKLADSVNFWEVLQYDQLLKKVSGAEKPEHFTCLEPNELK